MLDVDDDGRPCGRRRVRRRQQFIVSFAIIAGEMAVLMAAWQKARRRLSRTCVACESRSSNDASMSCRKPSRSFRTSPGGSAEMAKVLPLNRLMKKPTARNSSDTTQHGRLRGATLIEDRREQALRQGPPSRCASSGHRARSWGDVLVDGAGCGHVDEDIVIRYWPRLVLQGAELGIACLPAPE